ncbi:hypothetical protein CM19_00800 [Candidatus Acidianus copahuensis]|uniref:Uncharacterized protein n=1 Tax=Candidatus Acidianus copahuensis TaxID=1160895 RepID=A0A031LUP8_9CREN|nr:hypothetical protein [Candidatus Acidianus copahuensis]EZQ11541.1 hypothetical protein CM19_00800 [Candidatus Acidianus copahuensis]
MEYKEYLARTSVLSYLSLSSLSLLFFGLIEDVIANVIATIISVSIASVECNKSKVIIAWVHYL